MKISLENIPTPKEIQTEKARRKLIDFTKYTMPDYDVSWHHENLAEALDRLANKEIKRLMVFMPPRHGKSELVSRRFPAYILGKNPNAQIISTSYSADLASSMNRDVQRIIESPEYEKLFPNTKIPGVNVQSQTGSTYVRNANNFEVVDYKGTYKSAGVGGGITGRGADYAIIDDPVKNRKDAESPTFRENTFNWFSSTLYTRLEKDACILITLTRWHEDDLAGKLLTQAENDPEAEQWEVIRYPAIYDENIKSKDETDPREAGQPLWEGKFDAKALKTIKSTVGSYEWSALYQQVPTPPSGGIIKRDHFNYYNKAPTDFDEILQSWDFTFKDSKGSDYVVGQVWGRKEADKYLLDQVRGQFSFTQSIKSVKSLSAKWPKARAKLIEDKANGPAVISTLKNKISGLIPIEPVGSKEERAHAVSPQFEAGNVYVPDPSIAPWVHDYIEELVSFPNGLNDDQMDGTTQALIRFENHKPKPKVKARAY
ncbi:phage terminase large subunit [Virgibacillus sp. CBA3643]|uniref:phage terminase large subunit n=1 Tax=Virgibacillus sp. CBA3643 TaxID=2942278 RepID=UPI0035A26572